jgi:alpha-mannosidase
MGLKDKTLYMIDNAHLDPVCRQAENLLLAAEKWGVIAQRLIGQPYPTGLDRAWKNVLFNQFHDILAGTAIEAAYEDARDLYGEAQAIGGRALNYALQGLTEQYTLYNRGDSLFHSDFGVDGYTNERII